MNQPPVGHLAHFAVNADDIDASRRFYESVFGWQFKAWGPPGFFHIHDANGDQPGPIGVVQARRDLVDGQPTTGFECTIAVDDVDRGGEHVNLSLFVAHALSPPHVTLLTR